MSQKLHNLLIPFIEITYKYLCQYSYTQIQIQYSSKTKLGNPVSHLSLLRRKRRHKVKPPKREKMDGPRERKRKTESKLRTKREKT